ncbi:DUF1476 domain-containing protein [Kiloniella sp. b19]|uniref:DUF1476 domain-containing protein n=1 Tax=Kiloniella sp. GXU_MW_B19 TaxID=3141326 RepID=UPI0031D7B7D8
MATMSDREKAFEDKFQHDEEIRFKVEARQVKLLGLWVAGQLGKSGDEAEAYAKELVTFNLGEPGLDDVVGKVMTDLEAVSSGVSKHQVERNLAECEAEAKQQIMAE